MRASGADSVAFRRQLMSKHPKHLAVLNAAAQHAGWGQPLPPCVFRGIAQFMGHGSHSAAVADMPKVDTVIVPSFDFWGGVGEPTICVVTPCVLNAIHAASAKPMHSLPLKNRRRVA